jgi:hypothetical protein
MGKIYDGITPKLNAWIKNQHLFFVATAPLSADGHVNTSPKGLDSLRIINPHQVAYLDITGTGAETIAHLRENRRIVLMFCAFIGRPKIVRLHGKGTVVTKASENWSTWCSRFPDLRGPRSVIVIDVERVSDSCGFGVPIMEYKEDRETLDRYWGSKGDAIMPAFRREENSSSIDGLAALEEQDT